MSSNDIETYECLKSFGFNGLRGKDIKNLHLYDVYEFMGTLQDRSKLELLIKDSQIELLQKKNGILMEAVDDILTDNLYQNEIHNILEEALEKIKQMEKSIMDANMGDRAVQFIYTNHRGLLSTRMVKPISVNFRSSEWHPIEQWLMLAFDYDKQAEREFAMRDIRNWKARVK